MRDDAIARRLAWASLAGQALFTIGWVVAGATDAGYSHVRDDMGSLAGEQADHRWVGVVALVALAVSIAALAPAVTRTVPRRARLAGAAFAIAGLATLGWALFPVECDLSSSVCQDRFDAGLLSWQHSAHLWFGLAMSVAILATTLALTAALWPRPAAVLALGAGVWGIAIKVVSFASWGHGADGLVDRLGILALHLWFAGVAIGVLYATRPAPPVPEPTPLRPRDFFGRDWTGSGTVTLWPFALWRRRPFSFRLSRTATWFSDEAWTFEDRADFDNGWSESRIRFCHFDSPTHVRVVSSDMPDGADVLIDDDGYRIVPYRMTMPLGPMSFPVRCYDSARVQEDGSLIETVDLRFGRIPLARVVMRARTVAPVSASGGSRAASQAQTGTGAGA
jgi:hypothetical protein